MKTIYCWNNGQWSYREEIELIPELILLKFKSFDVQDDTSVEQIGKMVKTAHMLLQGDVNNKERFVWFSPKQDEENRKSYNDMDIMIHKTMAKLLSGEIKEYTDMTSDPKPFGWFDDYKFVGIGCYYKTEIYNETKTSS